ncbi:MAG: UDP-N-acetylmuramoyl-L-alanyl-D-glutamate--2,6-diaminopimelate ligase [Candidatus Hydrothermales bacterium]
MRKINMNLGELFKSLKGEFLNYKDSKVEGIAENSKEVKKNYIFVALQGLKTHGKNHIDEAIKNGAICLVTDEKIEDIQITQFITEKPVETMHEILKRFYGIPEFKIIGVTGTNGKTTITNFLSFVFKKMGIKNGVIGTLNSRVDEKIIYRGYTTPPSTHLYKIFDEMKKEKVEYLFMELTSHGLEQKRIFNIEIDGLIYTGITRDHLDFHKTMENYYNAKKKAFDLLKEEAPSIINVENIYGKRVFKEIKHKNKKCYGMYLENLDFRVFIRYLSSNGMGLKIEYENKKIEFETKLIGKFNAYNTCSVFAILKEMGFKEESFIKHISEFEGVEGRLEKINTRKGFDIYIDYAHTPDAIGAVLETLKSLHPKKIITVFGAGGNRDKEKRPIMGRIAAELSDTVILTTDNPRFEDPYEIIEDIKSGIPEGELNKVIVEIDRKKAIEKGIEMAEKGDLILIAGKGHEDYMEIKGKRIPFKDKDVVLEILREKNE